MRHRIGHTEARAHRLGDLIQRIDLAVRNRDVVEHRRLGQATWRRGRFARRLGFLANTRKHAQERFHGARVQRPLWASTSVKDKAYSDLLYADALIGPDTVDTMPRETLEAFRDHGTVADTVDDDIAGARATMAGLAEIGIDFKQITDKLEEEGVDKFVQSFDALLKGIVEKRAAMLARA